jgi:hypothetical protein
VRRPIACIAAAKSVWELDYDGERPASPLDQRVAAPIPWSEGRATTVAIEIARGCSSRGLNGMSEKPVVYIIDKDELLSSALASLAAKPTAAFDAKWGNFVIGPDFFTRLVFAGV